MNYLSHPCLHKDFSVSLCNVGKTCKKDMKMEQIESLRTQYEVLHNAFVEYKGVRCTKIDVRKDTLGNPTRVVATLVPDRPDEIEEIEEIKEIRNEDGDQFTDPRYYTLPNGLLIAHQSTFQTNILYPEIFEAEVYQRHGITLNSGDCVFDVGANIGLFSLFVAKKCAGDVQLYAFEPSPATFAILRTNASLHAPEMQLCNYGLSNETKTAPLVFFPNMSGMSGLFSHADDDMDTFKRGICNWVQKGEDDYDQMMLFYELDKLLEDSFSHSETYTCQFRTLSSVIAKYDIEHIDLLKIDVEKSELDVLRGIQENDWHKIKQIVAEVHTVDLLDQIVKVLAQHNFDIVVEMEEDGVMEEDKRRDEQQRLSMLYAIQRQSDERSQGEPTSITYVKANRPQLSVEEMRRFVQAKLPNYTLLGELRSFIRDQYPEYAALPVEFILSTASVPSSQTDGMLSR